MLSALNNQREEDYMSRVALTIKDYGTAYAPIAAAEHVGEACVACDRIITAHTRGLLTIGGQPVHTSCAATIGA